ncbi:MAG: response regulator [Candidatus Competibacteraceae bacterium]|nr:response regulator [Candidatus Competibacteraceae bacterium]MCB1820331.1 response regulator [Candidatus Competibacteraceae bacterium]
MSHRILLVDDDRLILSTLGNGLHQAGYTVTKAGYGETALALTQHHPHDLAILDIRLPDMSGIELARQLWDAYHLPALFLSAYSDKKMVKDAINEGGLSYLVKPVDMPQLIPAIETALARSQDLKALDKAKNQLEEALKGRRDIATATGILMERQGLWQQEAFELLRAHARTQRRRLESLARDVINAAETLNALKIKN